MKLQIIPFRARHLPHIRPDVNPEMQDLAWVAQEAGNAFTACLLGEYIGAAGVIVRESNLAEAWAVFSPTIKTFKRDLYVAVKHGLQEIIDENKVKKVTALIDPADAAAKRFIEHLGFNYGMTRDFYYREVQWAQHS